MAYLGFNFDWIHKTHIGLSKLQGKIYLNVLRKLLDYLLLLNYGLCSS